MDGQMKSRYSMGGKWFKGNTHVHSKESDGGLEPAQLADGYAGKGYHFLFKTDHWVASDFEHSPVKYPLLWLDGMELDGKDDRGSAYHIVCLGRFDGIARGMKFTEALQSARNQGGLLILAHPYWMGNSLEDALYWNFDGVEIYNYVCHWLNGKSDGAVHWNFMLRNNPNTLGFAADDAHILDEHPLWNGAWIMVNAPELSRGAIMSSIRSGNYYSSCGPEFHSISVEGNAVKASFSPVRFMRLVGPGWWGRRVMAKGDDMLTEWSVEIPADWQYAYLEIEDAAGKRAWSNTLRVTEQNTIGEC